MGIRSTKEIYQVLEKYLRQSSEALTCVTLMDFPEVREAALAEYGKDVRIATNKVSDALGLMWRRNLLTRFPAASESNSLARYAYQWIQTAPAKAAPLPPSLLSSKKTGVVITEEDGGVRIDFEKFTVVVIPK